MERFTLAAEYKRQELLAFVGSRQGQSGVIWGPRIPNGLICTSGGRHGRKAGYADEQLADGSWYYFGQGTVGPQNLKNPANAKLSAPETTVFLFQCREPTTVEISHRKSYGKLYKYMGQFVVAGHEQYIPTIGTRAGEPLFRFHLLPVNAVIGVEAAAEFEIPKKAQELKDWILNEHANSPNHGISTQRYWLRCLAVSKYAKLRANGRCEGCLEPAPFLCNDESPFLEVHHLKRLADAGADTPENVAALCPNCHRRVHYGSDGEDFNQQLTIRIAEKEQR